jgi:hypothetical protein
MENLSQLVTQEDYLGLQVLRITHHCYGLALNTSRSPHKAWKSCFTPRNTGPAGISPAQLHIIVGAASRYRTPSASAKVRFAAFYIQSNFDKRDKKKAQANVPLRHYIPLKVKRDSSRLHFC